MVTGLFITDVQQGDKGNLMTPTSLHHDFIVVGGGSAGCAVTANLVTAGYRVALVEAGPDYGAHDEGNWPAEILNAGALANSHDWDYRAGRWVFQRAR